MDSAANKLAAKILDSLVAQNLLTSDHAPKLLSKIAEGKMRPEDWQLPLEMALEKETNS